MNTRTIPAAVRSACSVYSWCIEQGSHDEHVGAETIVAAPRKAADPIASAYVCHFPDFPPAVCIQTEDFSPEQARAKARELRTLADAIDAMADAVDTINAEVTA